MNPASMERGQLCSTQILVAGAMAGAVSRLVVQPLDVVKIRLQLQVESLKNPVARYHCTSHAFYRIVHEEGLLSLWKGHGTGQLQAAGFSLVQFAVFEVTSSFLSNQFTSNSHLAQFFSGSVAGAAAAVVSQPMDVLRTRFIAQGEPRAYHSMVQAGQLMLSQEGVAVFFRGLVPSLTQLVPQTGLQFGLYTMLRSCLGSGPLQTAVAGATAGLFSKLVVYPFDVCKRRLQVAGFQSANYGQVHRGTYLTDCLRITIKREGVSALFKGLQPSLLKAALSIGVRFSVYEQLCRLLSF